MQLTLTTIRLSLWNDLRTNSISGLQEPSDPPTRHRVIAPAMMSIPRSLLER